MHASKRKKLEAAGYKVGDAADFLDLSPEEAALIDVKVKLASQLVALRKKAKISQSVLAQRIGSSQSRVAKMEACDPSVSMDLMFKTAFALGASHEKVGKLVAALAGNDAAVSKRKAAAKKVAAKKKAPAKKAAPRRMAVA
tara:strand:+ start:2343 stop:2765 length:423 start_codon:yes stop_codon:yes gene_type:complete